MFCITYQCNKTGFVLERTTKRIASAASYIEEIGKDGDNVFRVTYYNQEVL